MRKHSIYYYGEKDLGLKSGPKFCIQVKYIVNASHLKASAVIGKILGVEFKMDVFRKELSNGHLIVTYIPGYNPSGSTRWFNDELDIVDVLNHAFVYISPIQATGDQ